MITPLGEAKRLAGAFKRRLYRPMSRFAEEEIILTTGPYEGSRMSLRRQPFMRHWFDAVDSHKYVEHVITGPSQSGKSLCGFVIPICYYLFELRETVIAAVPDDDIAADKWDRDLEPVIARSRYRDLLPMSGRGSKGGRSAAVHFRNGAVLRFMTAGGSDKSRASFTSRIICMTETDGFDVRTSTSAEANKIEQIEARARSFPLRQRRIFKECTLTTADGHTWQKYQAGTRSKIVLPCPHCQAWVTLERENFTGWQNAASDVEAVDNSKFSCSCCGKPWSESERAEANDKSKLLHRGQRIEDGKIVGEAVATYTLGFRWSAVNNMLVPAADVAADEYAAKHAIDEDDAQRKLSQFVWAVPYEPAGLDDINLTASEIKERQTSAGRGVVPEDTRFVTIGIDVNKTMLHWVAIAWRPDDVGHVIDYGRVDPDWKGRAWNVAFRECLEGLYKSIGQGWTRGGFNRIHIDSRWQTTDVIRAIKSLKDPRVRPFMGLGLGHWKRGVASDPTKLTRENIWAGDRCYERVNAVHQAVIMFADSNYWKTWLHSRLLLHNSDGVAVPGQITLFGSMDPAEHDTFARQLTAEKEVLLFERGKGHVKQWEAIRSANHYLDAAYMACVGGCRLGVGKPSPVHRGPRMMEQEASPKAEDVKRRPAMRSRGFTSAGNGFRSGNFHRR